MPVVNNACPSIARLALRAGLLVATVLAPAVAWACNGPFVTFSRPGFIVTINPALATGSVLASSTVTTTTPGSPLWTACRGNLTHAGVGAYNATYQTYATAIPGIGMRLTSAYVFPYAANDAGSGRWDFTGYPTRIDLIKTGNITAGGTIGGVIATQTFHSYGRQAAQVVLSSNITVTVPAPTCTFTVNGGRDVQLGSHDARAATGVGGASPWQSFDITSGGCNASTTRVNMAWRGTVNPNNATLFAVTGALRGVGVEIQRADTNVRIAPNGAAQQWAPRAAWQVYPHRARFVQTLGRITEGAGSVGVNIIVTYN